MLNVKGKLSFDDIKLDYRNNENNG